MAEKYAWSHDEETYYGDFATREEAAIEGTDGTIEQTCFVGRCVPPTQPEDRFDIDDLIDHVSCQDDYLGDHADKWYRGTREQEAEINREVRAAIAKWLDKHDLRPTFYNITDVEYWRWDGDGFLGRKPLGVCLQLPNCEGVTRKEIADGITHD